MERIENAMVEDGHWAESEDFGVRCERERHVDDAIDAMEDAARWEEQMARLDASADAMVEEARKGHAENAELLASLRDYTDAVNAANDALGKVLKVYRGL